jgi:hypothetical protein
MIIDLEKVFCEVDDFCQVFELQWKQQLLQSGEIKRRKASSLSLSEVMTLNHCFPSLELSHL